jgi:hypothetical protein
VDRIEIWISHPDGVQKVVARGELLEKRKQEFIGYCEKYHEMWQTDKISEFYTQKYIASQNN